MCINRQKYRANWLDQVKIKKKKRRKLRQNEFNSFWSKDNMWQKVSLTF